MIRYGDNDAAGSAGGADEWVPTFWWLLVGTMTGSTQPTRIDPNATHIPF